MEYTKALSKCMQMCSRKEYCVFDISQKLRNWELKDSEIDKIIASLIAEKFIDEKRFVKAFVNDKFKFNHWGKVKINYYLKQKQLSSHFIDEALISISMNEYEQVIAEEVKKKIKKVRAMSDFERNAKVANYLASKGFEADLVFQELNKLK